ncbi:MAG: type VI secretion system tip protein VgrG, partial [Chloroflexi bacterium]|nr:type VI secretion system tip protein VgrG [Chloroflexota bacterium]
DLMYSDHPGEYVDRKVGRQLVQTRLEELRTLRHVAKMSTTIRGLLPGHKFTLKGHTDANLNREWVVLRITHRARQPQSAGNEGAADSDTSYQNEILAIPAETKFRPPRSTPLPLIHGSQTAIVVGPESEEIHVDAYGRVKVRFHWDQEEVVDENRSCWIRVSQGWAGGQYGMMFLPRVGHEVIVSFLEGDPDRPIITGCVYNGDHMPPYKLPDEKTKSTIKTHGSPSADRFHELRFEDLHIDGRKRTVEDRRGKVHLTAREFDLLFYLASSPGQVFSREQLMNSVWDYEFVGDSSTVTVHMRRLRAKVEEDPSRPRHLKTVWGVGYKFEP